MLAQLKKQRTVVDIRRGVTDGQRIITLHGPGLDGWDPDKPEPPEGRTP